MLRDKEGNRLFRRMEVKVIFPDAIFPERKYVQHAGPKQGFGPEGVHAMLEQIADQLDTLFPWWDFTPIELIPEGRTTRWIFKFAGYRDMHGVNAAAGQLAQIQPRADSTTPKSELPEDITLTAITEAVGTTLQDLATQATGLGE
jgi:hypothetical protein